MKLSIVIINYNVQYFLEQCLLSVQRAIVNIPAEVFVVDNASTDDSVQMIRQKFSFVKIIANTINVGFSKANNQAIQFATGEFVLLLNPDTVVAEDTFEKCIAFMQQHTKAGAIGVRMVDGKGVFLPESKRGLPTPFVAFCKTFGLSALFPKSKTFGRYHLGFLPENEINEVDILSGAFMFMRKSALDKVGLLDEAFFMYGEDVDLSYRITKGGFKNYYLPTTTIIHYKGESTKKGSLNYVKVFYNAMIIFARKHYSGNQSGIFTLLINFAIVFRGMLTLLAALFASSYLFIIDALFSFVGIYFIKSYWEDMIKYSEHYYPNEFLFLVVPGYILIWIAATFLNGGYDKPFKASNILRGIFTGTIAIAVLYAFIPDAWRFSRAIILLGATWTAFEMLVTRMTYHLVKYQSFTIQNDLERKTLIVAQTETMRAEAILRSLGRSSEIIQNNQIGYTARAIAINDTNEVIFCSHDFLFADIIKQLTICGRQIDYKILNPDTDALIGSNSKNTAGDLYVAEKNYALFSPQNKRSKRVLDLTVCSILLLLLPINLLLIQNRSGFWRNWWMVFIGVKSWVGLSEQTIKSNKFSEAFTGVLKPYQRFSKIMFNDSEKLQVELHYVRHYNVNMDIASLIHGYKYLGQ